MASTMTTVVTSTRGGDDIQVYDLSIDPMEQRILYDGSAAAASQAEKTVGLSCFKYEDWLDSI